MGKYVLTLVACELLAAGFYLLFTKVGTMDSGLALAFLIGGTMGLVMYESIKGEKK